MKYIRTKNGIYESEKVSHDDKYVYKYEVRPIWCVNQDQEEIIKQADTIEELCDCFSYDIETTRDFAVARSWKLHNLEREIYGCVKTDKGLIYVAKMNDKGELELL